ncbi:hypothetical protein V3C99_012102 [Haemonchus contortus]|uniref:RNA-binding protein 28 n=1 Tax=Haemonchus contortus TaxID=6289 RepID=A0A7I4Y691_HAECO
MEKHGYQQPSRTRSKRTTFSDEGDDVVTETASAGKPKGKKSQRRITSRNDGKLKSWRLIIRNLSFKTTREDLQNVCSKFGSFTDIVLPASKKIPGRSAGFAFVQFKTRESAEKAYEFFNSKKFEGRLVAADWALPKDTYETAVREEREKLKKKVKLEEPGDPKEENSQRSKPSEPPFQPTVSKIGSDAGEEENMSDDNTTDNSSHEDSMEGEDARMDIEEDGDDGREMKRKDPAVDEKRVVFLRNLSFATTNETLKKEMEKFGEVKLAICCKFRESGHSRGTAFVHFSKPEEAKACLEAAENGLQIDGRDVVGSLAMQRENATSIQKRKNLKVPEDKRNLRLVRFSLIREGTSAANGMSSEDARKRQRLAESSRRKLENLHMFISPTRLMVHNLPSSMTDGKLREICLEAAGKFAHITECRIWKDTSKLDSKGNARSKGYAFVNFSEHSDALQCLQKLNNNPHIFTNERRPIVEFAIENLLAIRAKVRRSAHSKGETLTGRELSDKVKIQVKHSIEEVSKSGMKVMPKFLGRKLRHKNMSKTQLKKKRKGSQSSSTNSTKKFKKEDGTARNVGAKKNKKLMTKYLAFSS